MSIRFQNVAGDRAGGDRTRIQLCGRLSVEIDRVQLAPALRGKQVPLLLAYLALNRDRHVSRDELAVALWPEHPPRSQEAALRTLLSRLRSALGPDALDGRDELILELPEPVWVDVEAAGVEMERARHALERGDARTGWALAQVPFNIASRGLLPGSTADWIDSRRRELEDLRLEALEVIGRAGLRLGGTQLASVERAAHTLIEAEPYRESGYVLLMEALAARGNVAEGLRVFDRLRSLLRDELGTNPSPETIAAHERLLRPQARTGAGEQERLHPAVVLELPPELQLRSGTPLVGRRRELDELAGAWGRDPTLAGEGNHRERVVLLAGDAGIGKTRLVAELARTAHEQGGVVLAGHSPQENVVPYQPFLEALRHYILNIPVAELRAHAREYGAELARLVPEIRRRAPELAPPAATDPEPETERYRLFEAVVGLLQEISASAPVLLVMDDLQWADRPTLLLLRHLARAPGSQRVLILGAYRATEAGAGSFADTLTELRRERLVRQLDIRGLSRPETAELVTVHAGATPTPSFTRALHEETEGNPFFIEEIVRHLTEAGIDAELADAATLQQAGLPEGVKDVIARRLQRLRTQAVECLRVAAVIGRDFDAALLEGVVSLAEDEFLGALEEALAADLIVAAPDGLGRYSFSHALIRETLYEGMSTPRRARIHRRVGEAIERSPDGERQLSLLALHFTRAAGAQDAEKAIEYALRAGEQATTMLAHEEAANDYDRALEVLRRFLPDARERRLDLLLLLGEAQVRVGERLRAAEAFREAAELAEELGNSASLARAAIGASRRYIQQPGVVDEELIGMLRRALELSAGERTLARVELLASLCGALYYSAQRDQMDALTEEAMQIAEELDDDEARANAYAARRRARWDAAHLRQRLETSTEMLKMASSAGHLELELQAHAWLVVDLLEHGDRDAVDAQIETFTSGADALRQPLYIWNAIVWRAMRALLAGELDRAEQLARDALAAGASAEAVTAPQYYAIQLMAIRREQDRISELEPAARQMVQANPGRPAWRAALAAMLVDSGREAEAAEEFELLAAGDFADIPVDGDWMTAVTLISDVCVALGDGARAAILYDLLMPYRDANVVIGLAAVCLGSAARFLGKLAATMGRPAQAAEHFERALAGNAALGAPVCLAHTQLDYAQFLPGSNRAQELVQVAHRVDLAAVSRRAQLLGAG